MTMEVQYRIALHKAEEVSGNNVPVMADGESNAQSTRITKEGAKVLREAKIVARWAEKPFYIS